VEKTTLATSPEDHSLCTGVKAGAIPQIFYLSGDNVGSPRRSALLG